MVLPTPWTPLRPMTKGRAASVVRVGSSRCCSSWWALSRSRTKYNPLYQPGLFTFLEENSWCLIYSLKGIHLGDLSSTIRD